MNRESRLERYLKWIIYNTAAICSLCHLMMIFTEAGAFTVMGIILICVFHLSVIIASGALVYFFISDHNDKDVYTWYSFGLVFAAGAVADICLLIRVISLTKGTDLFSVGLIICIIILALLELTSALLFVRYAKDRVTCVLPLTASLICCVMKFFVYSGADHRIQNTLNVSSTKEPSVFSFWFFIGLLFLIILIVCCVLYFDNSFLAELVRNPKTIFTKKTFFGTFTNLYAQADKEEIVLKKAEVPDDTALIQDTSLEITQIQLPDIRPAFSQPEVLEMASDPSAFKQIPDTQFVLNNVLIAQGTNGYDQMATGICPECGQVIDKNLTTCPGCGFPLGSLWNEPNSVSNNEKTSSDISGSYDFSTSLYILGGLLVIISGFFTWCRFKLYVGSYDISSSYNMYNIVTTDDIGKGTYLMLFTIAMSVTAFIGICLSGHTLLTGKRRNRLINLFLLSVQALIFAIIVTNGSLLDYISKGRDLIRDLSGLVGYFGDPEELVTIAFGANICFVGLFLQLLFVVFDLARKRDKDVTEQSNAGVRNYGIICLILFGLMAGAAFYSGTRCTKIGCNNTHLSGDSVCSYHKTGYSSNESTTTNNSYGQSSSYTDSGYTSSGDSAEDQARRYLRSSAFSYSGLVKQLEYEGYSNSEAKRAADKCGADWKEQALKSAKSYLRLNSGFSEKGLKRQLVYEGFTDDEAAYGVKYCGADWNEQAVKSAKSYRRSTGLSGTKLREQLEYEGFTYTQAVYGETHSK